jgi:hypothetical protein
MLDKLNKDWQSLDLKWLLQFAIFMGIFAVCVATVFNPVRVDVEYGDIAGYVSFGAGSLTGINLMAKVWLNNTGYFITVGIASVLSIVGALISMHNIKKEQYEQPD